MGDRKLRINLGRSTSKTIPYISRYPVNQPGAVSVNTWDNHSSPLPSPPGLPLCIVLLILSANRVTPKFLLWIPLLP